MRQLFGISNCADPEYMNMLVEREEAIRDCYSDPDDSDCMDMYEDES